LSAHDLGFAPGQVLDGRVDLRLATTVVGGEVHYRETVGSTNTVLRSMADAGAPEGTVVIAEEQTAGRGRSGRPWDSPPGVGLWFSVLLRPGRPASELTPLSMVTVVSVVETLRRDFGVGAFVKWPNDILAGEAGLKLGGVLLESAQAPGEPVEQLVVGTGLNVNQCEGEFPEELSGVATSVRMLLGKAVPRLEVLRSLLEGLERDWGLFEREGFRSFPGRWRALSFTLGRTIEVASYAGTVSGVVVDISPEGALVVEGTDGRAEVWHGDVKALV